MTTPEKSKNVVKGVATSAVKGVGNGIGAGIGAVWKYGLKHLIIAYTVISVLVLGFYNPLVPEYTLLNYFIEGLSQPDVLFSQFMMLPLSAGLMVVMLVDLATIAYVLKNVSKLGKWALGGIGLIVAAFSFWLFTLGTFDGLGISAIALIAQLVVIGVMSFGQVYSKIDRIVSGTVNNDNMSEVE